MAFEATKREWAELYTFFRILADGVIYPGTATARKDMEKPLPVALVRREEHDGTRLYKIDGANIHLKGENIDLKIARDRFGEMAELVLVLLKSTSDELIESPEEIERFLAEVIIYNLTARAADRTDLYIAFWDTRAPLSGFGIRSRIGGMDPLLDGGRSANLKFEQCGVRFAVPTQNKINLLESPHEVTDRMLMIERLGGVLKYADAADKIFKSNLSMIDLHFPRLLAEMLRIMHLEGITRTDELTERIKTVNPLKIKDELIFKHGFYEYKMKQFLLALALGMRPAKLYNGTDSTVSGFLFVDGSGEVLCYHKTDKEIFQDFLFHNSRFEKGAVEKDKYGLLERENGLYYFKLNAKIGLLKR